MEEILCHIVGINNSMKGEFTEIMKHYYKNVTIEDLDIITMKIRKSPKMKKLIGLLKTTKTKNTIVKQINSLWKESFMEKIDSILKHNKKNKIIFIGLSSFYKNHKLRINIKTANKFILDINPTKNAEEIIEFNMNKYKHDIIKGKFPLEYLDANYIVNQRLVMIDAYKKMGYTFKTLVNIEKWLESNYKKIYVGSTVHHNNIIRINKKAKRSTKSITGYTYEWLALLSTIDDYNHYVKYGFEDIKDDSDTETPYIREKFNGAFEVLKNKCYLYVVADDKFVDKIDEYEYRTLVSVKILNKRMINNIFDELKTLGIKMITFKK